VLTEEGREFHSEYRAKYRQMQAAADFAEGLVRDALREATTNFYIHQIQARAKDPNSLLRKLRRRAYEDPASDVTDQIAVRVVTYFLDQVDPIAERLAEAFDVDRGRSVDKRTDLGVREFGYRSVHLIVQARLTGVEGTAAAPLRDHWFEIQVRSLLEHAWAEIEHDVIYKSGVEYSEEVVREFHRAAAQLEAIDKKFLELRGEKDVLIETHREHYEYERELTSKLDGARISAIMEIARPNGLSFRRLAETGASLPPHVEACCVEALAASGIETAQGLLDALDAPEVVGCVDSYASLEGVVPEEVSHFAICVLAAGATDADAFITDFPDLVDDQALREALQPESPEE
jgi:ppGpp synthetase/RelA/SpoT-type nucleotidyltranferase